MKSTNYYKKYHLLKSNLTDFYKCNWKAILLFSLIFMFGFLIGIFFCSGNSSKLDYDNFFDQKLIDYLSLNCSNWSFFLNQLISFGLVCFIAIFLNSHILFIICNFTICLIRGYILGFNTVCIISLFSVFGIIFSIIIYVLICIIANLIHCLICAIAFNKFRETKKYGFCNPYRKKQYIRIQFLLLFIIVLTLFIQALLLILIRSTFVIS